MGTFATIFLISVLKITCISMNYQRHQTFQRSLFRNVDVTHLHNRQQMLITHQSMSSQSMTVLDHQWESNLMKLASNGLSFHLILQGHLKTVSENRKCWVRSYITGLSVKGETEKTTFQKTTVCMSYCDAICGICVAAFAAIIDLCYWVMLFWQAVGTNAKVVLTA